MKINFDAWMTESFYKSIAAEKAVVLPTLNTPHGVWDSDAVTKEYLLEHISQASLACDNLSKFKVILRSNNVYGEPINSEYMAYGMKSMGGSIAAILVAEDAPYDDGDLPFDAVFKGSRGSMQQWGFGSLANFQLQPNGKFTARNPETGNYEENSRHLYLGFDVQDSVEVSESSAPKDMHWYENQYEYLIRTATPEAVKKLVVDEIKDWTLHDLEVLAENGKHGALAVNIFYAVEHFGLVNEVKQLAATLVEAKHLYQKALEDFQG